MQPTLLSQFDLRRFNLQISNEMIGIDGQEKLKYSEVIIIGLEGIGIAVMSCLLSAGVGLIKVIDDGFVTESMLPSQTLFNSDDIGKIRCIVAYEKQIDKSSLGNLQLYNTKLKRENSDRLIDKTQIIIKTTWGPDFNSDILDLCDDLNLHLIGGFGMGWKGVFGTYSSKKKKEFRLLYNNLYLRNKEIPFSNSVCFSFVSNFIGAILASKAIKALLEITSKESDFFKIDLLNLNFNKIL